MGQVIVKKLCFTDQWLIFILVWKVIIGTYEKKLMKMLLLELRNIGVQEYIERVRRFLMGLRNNGI